MFKRWFIKKYSKEIQWQSVENIEEILIDHFIPLYTDKDKEQYQDGWNDCIRMFRKEIIKIKHK